MRISFRGFLADPDKEKPKPYHDLLDTLRAQGYEVQTWGWKDYQTAYYYFADFKPLPPLIMLSHSYGCNTAHWMIEELYKAYRFKTSLWCCIDYVPQNPVRNLFVWLTGLRRPREISTAAVGEVVNFYQRIRTLSPGSWPMGRIINNEYGESWVNVHIKDCNHVEIDDSPEVHKRIVDAVTGLGSTD